MSLTNSSMSTRLPSHRLLLKKVVPMRSRTRWTSTPAPWAKSCPMPIRQHNSAAPGEMLLWAMPDNSSPGQTPPLTLDQKYLRCRRTSPPAVRTLMGRGPLLLSRLWSRGGKSRLSGGIHFGLKQLLIAFAHQLLEDLANLPLAGGDPLPIRSSFHGIQGLFQRLFKPFFQRTPDCVAIHVASMPCKGGAATYIPRATKNGHTHRPAADTFFLLSARRCVIFLPEHGIGAWHFRRLCSSGVQIM